MIKAVIFDLVGTLIYTKDSVGTVYSNIANSYGFKTDPYILDRSFQAIFRSSAPSTDNSNPAKLYWKAIVYETFYSSGYKLDQKFDVIFEDIFKEFSKKNTWAIYPEVIQIMERLVLAKMKIGLISNFDSRLEKILKDLDLKKYFNLLVYSGKVGYSKPNPKIFNCALKELEILPEETIYVGDDLYNDYYPALKLNINVFFLDRNNLNQVKNVRTVSNLSQILREFET